MLGASPRQADADPMLSKVQRTRPPSNAKLPCLLRRQPASVPDALP